MNKDSLDMRQCPVFVRLNESEMVQHRRLAYEVVRHVDRARERERFNLIQIRKRKENSDAVQFRSLWKNNNNNLSYNSSLAGAVR